MLFRHSRVQLHPWHQLKQLISFHRILLSSCSYPIGQIETCLGLHVTFVSRLQLVDRFVAVDCERKRASAYIASVKRRRLRIQENYSLKLL